jgi:acyl-CoA hydrolase
MPPLLEEHLLASLVRPGQWVYVPGASGAPEPFMDALAADPARSAGLKMLTTYVAGINRLDIEALSPSARVTGLFMQPSLATAQREGRYRMLPMSYGGFVQHLEDEVEIDLTVVQVSPPDAQGRCSLGPAVEFMPVVLGRSRRVLGIVNHHTPFLAGAPHVDLARFDHVCDVDRPLPIYAPETDAVAAAIAVHLCAFIGDGHTVQLGLGKVPTALAGLLKDRRNLRFHSGMLSDGFLELAAAGALDPAYLHTACALVGSASFYRRITDFPRLRVAGCEFTHHPFTLFGIERFVAVNSALEVDLFGQCNLEHADGRAVSGAGGAPDFAKAARVSRGGRSIVVLPATHRASSASRIVPVLNERAVATLSRIDVDLVVTEHGAALLTGTGVHERAEALIAIAAPEFRNGLETAWREVAVKL